MSKTTFKLVVVAMVAVWAGCVAGLLTGDHGYAATISAAVMIGGSLTK